MFLLQNSICFFHLHQNNLLFGGHVFFPRMEELKSAMDEVAAKSSPDLHLIDRIGMVSVPCFQMDDIWGKKSRKITQAHKKKASLNHGDTASMLRLIYTFMNYGTYSLLIKMGMNCWCQTKEVVM